MNGNTVKDKLDDLVDVLDRLLKEITRIAESLSVLEDMIVYQIHGGGVGTHVRIKLVNQSDEAVPVELQPVEDE